MKPIEREGVTLKNSTKVAAILAIAALGLLVQTSSAFASHARPKSASPLAIRMVPAFQQCTTGVTGQHGNPLPLQSCSPPVQLSPYLTAKAPERPAPFTGATDGTGLIQLKVTCVSSIGPPVENGDTPPCNANVNDQEDVIISNTSTGVYCTIGTAGGQGLCTGNAGTAYNGKVLGTSTIRISDHYNNLAATPGAACNTDPTPGTGGAPPPQCQGTVFDLPFNVGAQCTNAICSYVTSADAVVSGVVKEFKRAVVELSQLQVQDAGNNGLLANGTPPTTGVCPPACAQDTDTAGIAAVQGLFIP